MKYFCYFNLHKFVFSLKNKKTGLVERHSDRVVLNDCIFKVSQAGRARVLAEKRKNVHAGVEGEVGGFDIDGYNLYEDFTELTYNPYIYSTFVNKETKIPVKSAKLVILYNKKVFAKDLVYNE
jgi:hypothetical protein